MQTEAVFEKIAERIQQEIEIAQKSIFVAVAWFTNKNIFNSLKIMAEKGCHVSLIINNDIINLESQINYNDLEIKNSKVYKISKKEKELMHNKFCVIDYCNVITGSYNWSYKAESNFENIIITYDDTLLAEQFIEEFNKIIKQYYPDDYNETVVFPEEQIIKRLEILKNFILLEDTEELKKETKKIEKYNFNTDLFEIIESIKQKEYAATINKIHLFIKRYNQLIIWTDPEISALKLEINNLENKLYAYDNEKIELEKILSEFQYTHTKELGEIILEILKLKKILYKEDKEKYNEAEQDEKQYYEQIINEKEKVLFNLTDEQKIEIKKKFRKASILCHPDKVDDKIKTEAQKYFIELKDAYDKNDIIKVNNILEDLLKGDFFKARSETINEKDILKAAIIKLKKQIKILEDDIILIKQSDTYKTIVEINDWKVYFSITKEKLLIELTKLKKQLGIKIT